MLPFNAHERCSRVGDQLLAELMEGSRPPDSQLRVISSDQVMRSYLSNRGVPGGLLRTCKAELSRL